MMKCEFCKEREGTEPITDSETGKELWVCEPCDTKLFDIRALHEKLAVEIDTQIKHHEEKSNIPAIRSLRYIKKLMFQI